MMDDPDIYLLTIQVVDGSYHDTIQIKGSIDELKTPKESSDGYVTYPGETEEEHVKIRRSSIVSERLELMPKKSSIFDDDEEEEKDDSAKT